MKVELMSYSQPDHLCPTEVVQDLVAYFARVSNPSNQTNTDNEPLIKYLIENKHWSPFEMVNICLYIETTRDIARQIIRHRSFSFQEFSQRYANPTKELDFEYREARLQDLKNRQNSIENHDIDLEAEWAYKQKQVVDAAEYAYNWAISKGIAKEVARTVLPEGATVSRLYMNGSLRSWIHYIQLRSANGTQKEHQEIALACKDVISSVFPLIQEIV